MVNLSERRRSPELLDQADPAEAQLNLENLRTLNRWTGACRELCRLLRIRYAPSGSFRFLDIGAGSGDMGRAVIQHFTSARAFSLDLSPEHLRHAAEPKIAADAFRLPFPDAAFQVAHCSLFLHHFAESEIEVLMREMYRVSSHTLLIQDLHRHTLAYYFLPATRWLFGWDRLMLHDGPVSVAAGWRRSELLRLLEKAGLAEQSKIHWHFPSFRYFIAIEKRF